MVPSSHVRLQQNAAARAMARADGPPATGVLSGGGIPLAGSPGRAGGSTVTAVTLADDIADYRAATQEFLAVAEGLVEEQLDLGAGGEDGWTPRMVIHHLADAETNAHVRLRRLLVGPEGTPIQGFDEAAWAATLRYDRPVARSRDVVRAVRESSAELLDTLTEADLERWGMHSEAGRYTVGDWLATYIHHPRAHADQIRAALG